MGNDEALRDNIFSHLSNDKWLNDERWRAVSSPLYREHIEMEKVKGTNFLEFGTTHVDILTVDKRALYIMVREVVQEVGGLISEDGMAIWITLDEFIERHQDILNLSYDEANEVSLKEAETMEAVEEPWEWYEDDEVDD